MAGESSTGNIEDRFDPSVVEPRKKVRPSRAALGKVKGKFGPSGVKFPRHPRNSVEMIEELYDRYGVDKKEYRLFYEKFEAPTTEEAVERFYGDPAYVAFFFKQFQLGLRLPLDPFINEFLETYDIVPAHIGANAVRYLTSFIVLCRCIGFEPCMAAFDHFFSVNYLEASRSISIRMDSHRPKIISPISSTVNKVSGWNKHVIYVESRRGWEFTFPTRRPHKARSVHKPSWSKDLIKRLEEFATVGTLSWAELEADSSYYIFAGLMRGSEGGVQPRVLVKRGNRFPNWVVHPNFVFNHECPKCRDEDDACLKESDIVGCKFTFLPLTFFLIYLFVFFASSCHIYVDNNTLLFLFSDLTMEQIIEIDEDIVDPAEAGRKKWLASQHLGVEQRHDEMKNRQDILSTLDAAALRLGPPEDGEHQAENEEAESQDLSLD